MRRTVQPAQPRATAVSIIAWMQFISAAITAILALYPSQIFMATLPAAVIGAFIWLPGLYLMRGYWLFATQRRAPASSLGLWVQSFIFNLPGLLITVRYLLTDYANYIDGPEFSLVVLPPLIGTVLGVLGIFAANLESKR
jgi:hypothetical protein